MKGAAKMTIGSMISHEIDHADSQCVRKVRSCQNGTLATAADIPLVRPDWITPKV